MATSYTSLLGFALPVTGELDGTWGTTVNNSITELVEDSIAATATASVTSGDWTLTTTGSGAVNQARCAILIPTGTPGVSRNIIAPGQSKAYVVINQSDAAVVLKASATTGATIAAGIKALVAWNASDFVVVSSTSINDISGTLPVSKGGTGNTTIPARSLFVANTLDTITTLAPSAGQSIRINAGNSAWEAYTPSTGTGDVTGPASSTANAIPTFSGTGGKTLQNSSVTISANVITADGFSGPHNGTVGATTPSTGVFTDVTLNAQGDVRFADSDSSNWVAFQAPATVTTNVTWTLPSSDGTSGQALVTNGAGTLTWTTAGAPPVGSLQYFAGTTSTGYPGSGWLLCDGSTVSQATYPTLYSRLGLQWTGFTTDLGTGGQQSATTADIYGLAAGNSRFMLADGGNRQQGRYSNNGLTWTAATGVNFDEGITTNIVYGDRYFTGGNDNSGGPRQGYVFTTTNGVAWTGTNISATLGSGVYPNYVSYASGAPEPYIFTTNNAKIYSTTDFSNYTTRTPSPGINSQIFYSNSKYYTSDGSTIRTSTDLANWTYIGPNFSAFAVGKGAGVFVIATGTSISSSTDRINYTARTYPAGTNNIGSVYFLNSTFVLGVERGIIVTSTNGANWATTAALNSLGTGTIYGILWDGSLYVANTDAGQIYTSTNLANWTQRSTGGAQFYGVAYGSDQTNKYISVGAGGGIRSSTDAITWTVRTSGTSSQFFYSAYGNGRYVAGDSSYISTSTDAVTWTMQTNRFPNGISGIVYTNQWYVTDALGYVHTSTDALNWAAGVQRGFITRANQFKYQDGTYIMRGNTANYMTSTDTVTWSNGAGVIVWGDENPFRIVNNVFFQLPYSSNGWQSYAGGNPSTSTDGINWSYITSIPLDSSGISFNRPRDITYGNSIYAIAAGQGIVYTSTNVSSWTTITGLSAELKSFYAATYGTSSSQSFIVAGEGGTMASSTDGVTWASYGVGTGSSMYRVAKGLSSGSDLWVLVGEGGKIFTSPNGENSWVSRTSNTASDLWGVTYGNGLWLVGGDGGVLRSSTDGINWTSRTSGTTSLIRAIASSGIENRYLLGTLGGGLRSSTDGINWTTRTSGLGNIYDVQFFANSYWILGDTGSLRSSSDGVTWSTRTTGLANAIYSMAYNPSRGDRFIVVGAGGNVAASVDGITWTTLQQWTSSDIYSVTAYNNFYYAVGIRNVATSGEGGVWQGRAISGTLGTYWASTFAKTGNFMGFGSNAVNTLGGFYAYNTATEFALPLQSQQTNVVDGSTPKLLYIRAT